MKKTLSVIGGDLRSLAMASLLSKDNYSTIIYGFDKNNPISMPQAKTLKEALNSEIIILPMPTSYDGETINAPFSEKPIFIQNILSDIGSSKLVLAGRVSTLLQEKFDNEGIVCIDYYNREELKVRNAVPTAEGAIEIALNEMPITLNNSKALVVGYGRIGKILSKVLMAMGAKTTVSARRFKDIAWIESSGCKAIHTKDIKKHIQKYDVIFNTVPYTVLDEPCLESMQNESLIIDLASVPGGVDMECAKNLNKKVIWALSLPGKTAPITAGEILANTIENILTELEEGYCGT